MATARFEECVFVNCPFDDDYDVILQAILFAILYIGLMPRLARERSDSAEVRLEKIRKMIEESKYSIHDLSRCQAAERGEYYRLNMPFELGLDYGCRLYSGVDRNDKRILILEEKRYRYQAALSDLAGCDIEAHEADFETAVRKVRNWFASQGLKVVGASHILNAYDDFQGWYVERQRERGFSEEDMRDYSTPELLAAMKEWRQQSRSG